MNKRILVIEDNTEVREVLEEVLELSGYDVTTAEDGTIGVQKAVSNPPDLIICDVMMPKLDGYGVLNILGKKPATADIPFVFLTAKAEKADFRRGMNLGADDYVTKPFYKDELLQVIERRLEKSSRLKAQFDKTHAGLHAFINEVAAVTALEKLSDDRTIKKLKSKENLFEEGDHPRYLYFVNSGKIKLFKTNDYGKELIIKFQEKGSFFGYTSLIKNQPYGFSASATEESEISLIPAQDFTNLLFTNRDVSIQFVKMLADNVLEKEEQLLNLAYSSVRKRVANAILELHQSNPESDIQILREDLARIVGTAKESVVRMLTEFKEDGFIDIENGVIKVVDLEGLGNVSG